MKKKEKKKDRTPILNKTYFLKNNRFINEKKMKVVKEIVLIILTPSFQRLLKKRMNSENADK